MKTIELALDKSRTTISGNPYGQEVYKEQVSSHFIDEKQITVIIPDHIVIVGMSFFQGFIHDIAEEFGIGNVKRHLIIKSSHRRVMERYEEAIRYYV